ncbi:DUF362 domain-containing protein [Clostridium sp. D2Q-11]|uniref:DUF362 domain-containing protein n=1 Tax=Anaeromonas frigoriresistens TaxID=2683708 RepID=A0A942Z8B1_9FIRM|nr:DUF362 domain-containing protein [Anaeromonas frigoriresistens]MBS4537789.1 DUF362 domain-containing protein [Anaeromonas frigoriresistens]
MRTRKVRESIVAIEKDNKEINSLEKCLRHLPLERIINENDRVVITPNWVKSKLPNTATVVGPETLDKLIKLLKKYNPGEIIVATGSGGDETPKVMNYVGYDKVIKDNNVKFIDLNYGPYTEIEINHNNPSKTKINNILENMDVLVSFTQLKMHEEATMSAGIKNIALGWPPAEIHGFPKKDLGIHEDLHGFISAITERIPIDLTIISADKVMIGTGPSDGRAIDTNGIIVAGTDPISTDTIGARMLGFLPQAINYLYKLHKMGIGEAELKNVNLKGIPLEEIEREFSLKAYNKEVILDKGKIKDFHGNK